ncbi:MAG: metallophosphoesterase [Myxococcales bacterium]|nr:metallophosphoesterase [Myxococcales bacterium]
MHSGPVYAIADVHGCDEELRALLQQLPLHRDALVVFLGDYIDRGPNSKGVVDTVLEVMDYCQVVCLLGNHELMLREFLDGSDARRVARFIYNGGGATLASYSNEDGHFTIPPEHLEFYQKLAYYHVEGDYCFVHAGIPVDVSKIDLALHGEDMVWMRRRAGMQEPNFDKIVVHGHTPVPEVEIRPRRINLDTSCVYGHRLTAMEVRTQQMWHVDRRAAPTPLYLRDSRESRREAFRFTGRVPVVVQHEGRVYRFATINYSEIGMLIKPVDNLPSGSLRAGAHVTGLIGTDAESTPFRGVVLRVDEQARHALKIIPEPQKQSTP